MRRETSDIRTEFTVDGAMAVALEFVEVHHRSFDGIRAERVAAIIDKLDQVGFEIVRKPADTAQPQRWVLAQVVPGEVRVSPDDGRYAHGVNASATATVVRWGGRGPGEQREISVSTRSEADTDEIGEATREAMDQAMHLAREAAAGFIEAASAPVKPEPEPAATA